MSSREYPAADPTPGILAVGASTSADTLASFSTYGAWVQVAAPGDNIFSTIPGGSYATWSGTSMAAPLAAGTVALLRAANPTLRPTDSVTRVATTAAAIDAPIRRRVDAAAALGMGRAKNTP
jgi:subtilisin family serine protease